MRIEITISRREKRPPHAEALNDDSRVRAAVLSNTRESAMRLGDAYCGIYQGIHSYASADAIRGSEWDVVIVDEEAWANAHIREAALLAARRGPRPRVLIECRTTTEV